MGSEPWFPALTTQCNHLEWFNMTACLVLSHVQLCYSLTVRLLCPWYFPGKNTAVGCRFLLQGIFPPQGLNPHLLHLLHWQAGSLPAEPSGKPDSTWRPYSKIKQIWISGIRTQTLAVFKKISSDPLSSWGLRQRDHPGHCEVLGLIVSTQGSMSCMS